MLARQGRAGGATFTDISSHLETGRSRLVADLSGEWSRFGSSCLGLSRFRRSGRMLLVPASTASGAFRPCFLGVRMGSTPEGLRRP